MVTHYGPATWSLTGEALKQADEAKAFELTEKCETESFHSFQSIGYRWTPTREMVMSHIVSDIDRHARNEDRIRWLALASVVEFICIATLAILLLKQ